MAFKFLQQFPEGFTPNQQQTKLLTNIEKAFDEGHKFVVCCAPTGSGKSFISKTIGNIASSCSMEYEELVNSYQIYKRDSAGNYTYGSESKDEEPFGAFALTITKSLQDQYKELFDDIKVVKGKSNYQCSYDNNFTVEYAPCVHLPKLKEQCWSANSCPYYTARNEAIVSKFAALNYNMFFALPSVVKKRQYLICDEASELEDQLVKEFSCQINFEQLRKCEVVVRPFPAGSDYSKVGKWLNVLTVDLHERAEELKEAINAHKKVTASVTEMKQELSTILKLRSKVDTMIDTWHDSEYLFDRVEKGVNFTPLKVDKLSKYIFDHADKIILMSATIIDPTNFCKTLGITNFKYIEADSTFDANKAPIYANTKTKLNFANLKTHLPNIVKQINSILGLHANEKGIIHTQSNYITNFLKENISSDRVLFREPGVRNEDILDTHYSSDLPTVLASPSMSHGVDLKGDLAKFQIIIKAPYLPTNDTRVERMMKLDFNWYTNKMLSNLIQACGRGVRSNKDFCTTYILDAAIIECIIKNKSKIPKYFIDRFM
jgi:Rad3-related DNA helicase